MKRLLSILFALPLLLVGCTDADVPEDSPYTSEASESDAEYVSYGDRLTLDDGTVALTPAALTEDLGTYQNTVVRVEGTVAKVCQMKGCWLTLQNPTGTPVRVQVPRDSAGYVFTFPTDLGPQEAIIEGTVTVDTMSVDELRHYAEDEGRPQSVIDAITAPEATVVLTARGALVRRPEAAVQS